MKNKVIYCLIGILFFSLSAFTFHKFYMGVFQVNYAAEKKMIQITSRIFVDDLNSGIETVSYTHLTLPTIYSV